MKNGNSETVLGLAFVFFIGLLCVDSYTARKLYERQLDAQSDKIEQLSDSLQIKTAVLDSVSKVLSENKPSYKPKFEVNSKFGEIYEYMKNTLDAPEACFALAVHETGGFTSHLCNNANNLFGFAYSKESDFKYWSKGDGHGKSGGSSWKGSIDYMKEWQEKFVRRGLDLSSNEAFIASLRRVGYATDPRHSLKVKNTFHNYFDSYSKEEQAKELLLATL